MPWQTSTVAGPRSPAGALPPAVLHAPQRRRLAGTGAPRSAAPTLGYDASTMRALWQPLTMEQTRSLRILIVTRWLLIAGAFAVTYVAAGTSATELGTLTALITGAVALNGYLHLRYRQGRDIPVVAPVLASLYDVAAITGAVALVDGFDNPNYLAYFPAFLAFTLVFPGWRSLLYCGAVIGIYAVIAVTTHDAFSWSEKADVKDLFVRLVMLGAALVVATMVVRIDRARRDRAVLAERAAMLERQRVSEEIHDGVSQNMYMLTMSLDDLAHRGGDGIAPAQLDPLVQMAKQTLLETRGLLTNLQPVLAGRRDLHGLLESQCDEFGAVTGVATTLECDGTAHPLPPETISDIYRITQEALANVYRHAGAQHVVLKVRYLSDKVVVWIEDDGRGVADPRASAGHGLANMRARAERLGGDLSLLERPGGGTRVRLSLPLRSFA